MKEDDMDEVDSDALLLGRFVWRRAVNDGFDEFIIYRKSTGRLVIFDGLLMIAVCLLLIFGCAIGIIYAFVTGADGIGAGLIIFGLVVANFLLSFYMKDVLAEDDIAKLQRQ